MTYEEVKNSFVLDLVENAYLTMCSTEEMQLAISALEKQVPKKPYNEDDTVWRCPNCNAEYGFDPAYDVYDYCPNCGQAVLWEEYK